MSPPDVALVWEHLKDPPLQYSIRVSLQDITGGEQQSDETSEESEKGGGDVTPASVLLYERQLRKAQHAKKVGMALDPKDLQVVYLDDYIIVVNKPAGMLCVPGINANPSLLDLVYGRYGSSDRNPQTMIVHRLDMDTSGLVIFARLPEVTKKLHAMFREQKVSKEYECLVMGHFPLALRNETENPPVLIRTLIDLPLQRDHENPPFMRVSTPQSEQAAMACVDHLQKHGWKKLVRRRPKQSQTILSVVEFGSLNDGALSYTRLRLEPITGRTHQLRVHCAALGYPIVGDPTYSLHGEAGAVGGLYDSLSLRMRNDVSALPVERCPVDIQAAWTVNHPPNVKPMCLHAAFLHLDHPVTGEKLRFEAPPNF